MMISPCDCDELFTLSEEIDDQIHAMADEIKKLRSQVQRILFLLEASPLLSKA